MFAYLIKQLAVSVLVLYCVMTVTFFLVKSTPGQLSILADPAMSPTVVHATNSHSSTTASGWASSSVGPKRTIRHTMRRHGARHERPLPEPLLVARAGEPRQENVGQGPQGSAAAEGQDQPR